MRVEAKMASVEGIIPPDIFKYTAQDRKHVLYGLYDRQIIIAGLHCTVSCYLWLGEGSPVVDGVPGKRQLEGGDLLSCKDGKID